MAKIGNMEMENSFMDTLIEAEMMDVRKDWEKAKKEGRIIDSWYVLYEKYIKLLEESLYLSGIKTTLKSYNSTVISDLENKLEDYKKKIDELLEQMKAKNELIADLLLKNKKNMSVLQNDMLT